MGHLAEEVGRQAGHLDALGHRLETFAEAAGQVHHPAREVAVLRQQTAKSYQSLAQGQQNQGGYLEGVRVGQEKLAQRLDQVDASLALVEQIDPLRRRVDDLAASLGKGLDHTRTLLQHQDSRAQNLEQAALVAEQNRARENEIFSRTLADLHQQISDLGGRILGCEHQIREVCEGGGSESKGGGYRPRKGGPDFAV